MYAVRRLRSDTRKKTRKVLPNEPVKGKTVTLIYRFTEDEPVMYWRKANHIHKWFVDNVQDGIDDERFALVPYEQLRVLRDVCQEVKDASELVDGVVFGGTFYSKEHPNGVRQSQPGKVLKDTTVAERLLPRQEGFFFGSLQYDEEYLSDVVDTLDWANRMLRDHENGCDAPIIYTCSW